MKLLVEHVTRYTTPGGKVFESSVAEAGAYAKVECIAGILMLAASKRPNLLSEDEAMRISHLIYENFAAIQTVVNMYVGTDYEKAACQEPTGPEIPVAINNDGHIDESLGEISWPYALNAADIP